MTSFKASVGLSDAVGQRVNSRQQPVKGGLQVRLRRSSRVLKRRSTLS